MKKLDAALKLHMQIEERYVYPLVSELVGTDEVFPDLKKKLDRETLASLGTKVKAAKSVKKGRRPR